MASATSGTVSSMPSADSSACSTDTLRPPSSGVPADESAHSSRTSGHTQGGASDATPSGNRRSSKNPVWWTSSSEASFSSAWL